MTLKTKKLLAKCLFATGMILWSGIIANFLSYYMLFKYREILDLNYVFFLEELLALLLLFGGYWILKKEMNKVVETFFIRFLIGLALVFATWVLPTLIGWFGGSGYLVMIFRLPFVIASMVFVFSGVGILKTNYNLTASFLWNLRIFQAGFAISYIAAFSIIGISFSSNFYFGDVLGILNIVVYFISMILVMRGLLKIVDSDLISPERVEEYTAPVKGGFFSRPVIAAVSGCIVAIIGTVLFTTFI